MLGSGSGWVSFALSSSFCPFHIYVGMLIFYVVFLAIVDPVRELLFRVCGITHTERRDRILSELHRETRRGRRHPPAVRLYSLVHDTHRTDADVSDSENQFMPMLIVF